MLMETSSLSKGFFLQIDLLIYQFNDHAYYVYFLSPYDHVKKVC